jgi:hypothetical protein
MAQPVRKRKKTLKTEIEDGLEYCNQCPFLGYNFEKDSYMCSPNDLYFGKSDNIPVPKWCGNSKKNEKDV